MARSITRHTSPSPSPSTLAGVSARALVSERCILGVFPGAPEVSQLVRRLAPIRFDLRKLSVVFLGNAPRSRQRHKDDPAADVCERLRSHGSMLFAGSSERLWIWMAGPIVGLVSPADGQSRSLRGVVHAIDDTLSRWGVRLEELVGLRASMASGRGLVLLHVTPGEVPSTLAAMKRAPAEYVTVVGQGAEWFGPSGNGRGPQFLRRH